MRTQGASSLTQIQQVIDPDNHPTPGLDVIPDAVMFPIISERGGTGEGTPGPASYPPGAAYAAPGGGAKPKGGKGKKTKRAGIKRQAAQCWGCPHPAHMTQPCNAEGCRHLHNPGEEGAGPGMHARMIGHVPDPGASGYSMAPGSAPSTPAPGVDSSPDAARYTPREFVPRSNSKPELMAHMTDRHGVSYSGKKEPATRFLMMLHENFHDGSVPDRPAGSPHQHEDPGSSLSIFGQRRQAADTCPNCDHAAHDGKCKQGDCECTYAGKHLIHSKKGPMRRRADFMTRPHQSTDDVAAPYNRADTSPDPWSQSTDPRAADFQAGMRDGQADARAGRRMTFADNSSSVSPYISGYAQGYSNAQPKGEPDTGGHGGAGPRQTPDVPKGMGGDSGQAMNSGEAGSKFQVSKASRQAGKHSKTCPNCGASEGQPHGPNCAMGGGNIQPETLKASAGFVSTASRRDPDFTKGYNFAQRWYGGTKLVSRGSAQFEAGLYAGITDRPAAVQAAWIAVHAAMAGHHPVLAQRLERHRSFTAKLAAAGWRTRDNGVYPRQPKAPKPQRTAGVSTDLITDGPGTSPDPMGSTPLNGPGTDPTSGGRSDPGRPGGVPPYQGAPPLSKGPVVTDDEAGRPQEGPQPRGPIGQGFSGPGDGFSNENQRPPGQRDQGPMTVTAPNKAAQNGYSNPDAYDGSRQGGDRVARLLAFRQRVQANLSRTGGLHEDIHTVMRGHKNRYTAGDPRLFSPDLAPFEISAALSRMGRPATEEDIRNTLSSHPDHYWPGHEFDTWGLAG